MVMKRDPTKKSVGGWAHEGFVVPPEGGYVQRWDVNGNKEFWIAGTNGLGLVLYAQTDAQTMLRIN